VVEPVVERLSKRLVELDELLRKLKDQPMEPSLPPPPAEPTNSEPPKA
jgi:hypothetical protein